MEQQITEDVSEFDFSGLIDDPMVIFQRKRATLK